MKWTHLLVSVVAAFALFSTPAWAADKIERTWKSKCASCHGADGKGATEKGKKMKIADMTSADFKAKKDDDMKKAIREGVKSEKDGVKKEMDAFKAEDLKDDQVDALIAFIKALK